MMRELDGGRERCYPDTDQHSRRGEPPRIKPGPQWAYADCSRDQASIRESKDDPRNNPSYGICHDNMVLPRLTESSLMHPSTACPSTARLVSYVRFPLGSLEPASIGWVPSRPPAATPFLTGRATWLNEGEFEPGGGAVPFVLGQVECYGEREERAAADQSDDPRIRKIHPDIAEAYARLAEPRE